MVEYLLLAGASISERNDAGSTPLLIACEAGQVDMVQYLLSKGANLEVRSHCHLTSP